MCWNYSKSRPTKPYNDDPFKDIANPFEIENIANKEDLSNYYTHYAENDATRIHTLKIKSQIKKINSLVESSNRSSMPMLKQVSIGPYNPYHESETVREKRYMNAKKAQLISGNKKTPITALRSN